MNYYRFVLAILLALMLLLHLPVSAQDIPTNGLELNTFNKEGLVKLVNELRQKGYDCGCKPQPVAEPVTWNDTLALAALRHSRDLYKNNRFSHFGSDSSTVGQRIKELGYDRWTCAENIMKGTLQVTEAFNSWRDSKGHCLNMMRSKFKKIGVARYGDIWTMVLAN